MLDVFCGAILTASVYDRDTPLPLTVVEIFIVVSVITKPLFPLYKLPEKNEFPPARPVTLINWDWLKVLVSGIFFSPSVRIDVALADTLY